MIDFNRNPHKPQILVIGDVMLDHYRIGDATRISPEAPVPVLLNARDEYRLGGAAAVAAMCTALGADTGLIGVTGNDEAGKLLHSLLLTAGVSPILVIDPDRPTTRKERICAVASGKHRQQLGRIDTESTHPIPPDMANSLAGLIHDSFEDDGEWDVVIIADYAKGVCQRPVIRAALNGPSPVFVDPPKGCDWSNYYHAECLTPNREEARGQSPADIVRQFGTQAAVVKLDQEGCQLAYRTNAPCGTLAMRDIPARVRTVNDVTACGDQFLATLAFCRAVNLDWHKAAIYANAAAGLQAERLGAIPITFEELAAEVALCPSDRKSLAS